MQLNRLTDYFKDMVLQDNVPQISHVPSYLDFQTIFSEMIEWANDFGKVEAVIFSGASFLKLQDSKDRNISLHWRYSKIVTIEIPPFPSQRQFTNILDDINKISVWDDMPVACG